MRQWLEPIYDAAGMRALDRWAIDTRGVPSLDLMERAGTGVGRAVRALDSVGPVAVVCGKGNNGGDGLVTARYLKSSGVDVKAVLLVDPSELVGDAESNYRRAVELGLDIQTARSATEVESALQGTTVVVDAVFGTGFSGVPRGICADAIREMNRLGAPVVAVDMPSGVDASTGRVTGDAVGASATVTFHAKKIGQWVMPGKGFAGEVRTVDIGIPVGSPQMISETVGLVEPSVLAEAPRRTRQSTKFTSGVLCVVGGSPGLTGAVCLAATGAARAGAGYVTAGVPASLNAIFEGKLLEIMTTPLPDDGGRMTQAAVEPALDLVRNAGAVVLGSGMGREARTVKAALELIERIELPLLIDADGLYALSGSEDVLRSRRSPTVLTPHEGELARLLGTDSDAVRAGRLEHARAAAQRTGAHVVLKGDDTIVVDPGGSVAISRGSTPALATAGTGDVLAGVIGAMLAKGIDPFAAASAGVYAHGTAATGAARRTGAQSMIASDVIDALMGIFG